MAFTKGHKPWNTGTKGIVKIWNKGFKGYTNGGSFKKGHKVSKKTKEKISKTLKGRKYGRRKSKGWCKDVRGRIRIWVSSHPFCNSQGYVFEHRLVMEKKIRRYLKSQEVVHHIDKNPSNNHPSNLQLFENNSKHIKFHCSLC